MRNTNTKSTILTRLNPYFKRSSILSDKQELLNCNKTQDFIRILEDNYINIQESDKIIKNADKQILDLKNKIKGLEINNANYNHRYISINQRLTKYESLIDTYKTINRILFLVTIIAILSSIIDKLL